MNKEIKVTSNYSEFGSKSDGETNLMNKDKKEKKPKCYYDWLKARWIYTNKGIKWIRRPKKLTNPYEEETKEN